MALYNVTELYAATTAIDLVNYANNATTGFLGQGFVLAVFFVTLLVVKRSNDTAESLMAASLAGLMISLLFRLAGIINFLWIIGFLAILAGTILYVYTAKR